MIYTKSSTIINNILKSVLLFVLFFLWLRYLRVDNIYAFIIAVVMDFLFYRIIDFVSKQRDISMQIKKEESKDIDKYMLSFLLNDSKENLKFFKKAIKGSYIDKNFVVYNNIALYPMFDSDVIGWEHIAKIVIKAKKLKYNSLIICCVESKLKKFDTKDIKVTILEKEKTYLSILKANDCYPSIDIDIKPKRTLSGIISVLIDKKRAKHYFYFAIISFLCSTFVFFKLYYLIVGTIFSVLALFCFLRKQQGISEENIWQ